MTNKGYLTAPVLVVVIAVSCVVPASAQQVHGVPGSPGATMTIDGKQLPPPPPKFGGVIKESAKDSKPYWPPRVVPPKGAPNVLLIMTDDQGYGVSGTFGGVIPTPAHGPHRQGGTALHAVPLHRALLADAGGADHRPQPPLGRLRRHRRNVHRLSRATTPSSARRAPPSATILKENGYATSWFGKNHNTPDLSVQRWPGPSTNGRAGWASSISTASWAARPTSGRPTSSAITRRSFRGSASPATTSPPTWRTRPSST